MNHIAQCGAKTRAGTPCKRPAGAGTDHLGQGRCKHHGGATPIKHGRYSTISRPRLRELLDQYENDPTPLDLLPEVKLLRALLTDWIERYDDVTDALMDWASSGREDGRRPPTIPEITDVAPLVNQVGAMVDRIEKHKRATGVSLETLDVVLERVGVELVHALQEEVTDGPTRSRVLENFERRWSNIRIAPNARPAEGPSRLGPN